MITKRLVQIFWGIIVLMCLVIIISIVFIIIDFFQKIASPTIDYCDSLNGTCEYWHCESNNTYQINWKSYYLLEEQNCLLKNMSEKW